MRFVFLENDFLKRGDFMTTNELKQILLTEFGPVTTTPILSQKLKVSQSTIYKMLHEKKLLLVQPGKIDTLSLFNCIW